MGDLYKGKKPSEMTAEEIAAIRDANSTKAKMGEGKVNTVGAIAKGARSTANAGKQLFEGMKNIVKDSMVRSTVTRMKNKENYDKTKK